MLYWNADRFLSMATNILGADDETPRNAIIIGTMLIILSIIIDVHSDLHISVTLLVGDI